MVSLTARMAASAIARAIARAALAVALVAPWGGVAAQGSAYVPLDDITYAYLDALIARGLVRELPALERPYPADAILTALAGISATQSRVVAGWVMAAERSARRYSLRPRPGADDSPPEPVAAALSASLFVTTQSTARRELMLADDSSGTYPGGSARLLLGAGPVVAFGRVTADVRLRHDPEFTGRTDRVISGRSDDGYVDARWRYGELFAGRTARSWGPPALSGLQLGSDAYSYDHLYARLGTPRLQLSTILARLDDDTLTNDTIAQRHFAIHRLSARVKGVDLALTESVVYGGRGRGLDPAYANPLNLFNLSQYNESGDGNVSYGADVSWSTRAGIYGAQLLVDDVQIDTCDSACDEPASWGATLTLDGMPLAGEHRWFASYTRVSNLAYRAPLPWERYDVRGVGLGRAWSDYDEARLGADLALVPRATVRVYGAVRRQGEGDYRLPYPAIADYATTPGFLSGVVTRVTRVGVLVHGQLAPWLDVASDVGFNRSRNADHVRGRSESAFEGRIRLSVDLAWQPRLLSEAPVP